MIGDILDVWILDSAGRNLDRFRNRLLLFVSLPYLCIKIALCTNAAGPEGFARLKPCLNFARDVTSPVASLDPRSAAWEFGFRKLDQKLVLGAATDGERLPEFERDLLELSDKRMGLHPKEQFPGNEPAVPVFARQFVEHIFHRSGRIGKSDIRAWCTHGQLCVSTLFGVWVLELATA